jgi:hypothetical protein
MAHDQWLVVQATLSLFYATPGFAQELEETGGCVVEVPILGTRELPIGGNKARRHGCGGIFLSFFFVLKRIVLTTFITSDGPGPGRSNN